MKNTNYYVPNYLLANDVKKFSDYIFKITDPDGGEIYVTGMCFEQEPEFGEGDSPKDISVYPLLDLCDEFNTWVFDSCDEENEKSASICYLVFGFLSLEDVVGFQYVFGKHVYNEDAGDCVTLVID